MLRADVLRVFVALRLEGEGGCLSDEKTGDRVSNRVIGRLLKISESG